jgi:hypothetical protein
MLIATSNLARPPANFSSSPETTLPKAAINADPDQREGQPKGYTYHEVVAPREVGPVRQDKHKNMSSPQDNERLLTIKATTTKQATYRRKITTRNLAQ